MSDIRKRPMRQLPPTAVPITNHDLLTGIRASSTSHTQFTGALAEYFTISEEACVLASSGRTVLYYLLKGLQEADSARSQVIIPAYTCPALAKVTLDLGLKPIFVDIDPDSTRYKIDHLSDAICEKTLAIMLVHPFGIPLPIEDIQPLAQAYGVTIIEDAAQAMGARWQERSVGLRGDFGVFSLGPGKPISTGGGGIVITNDPDQIPTLQSWWRDLPPNSALGSAQAWLRQASFQAAFHPTGWWAMTRAGLHRLGNHEASWGYALSNLTAVQAAIGLSLLPRLDDINAQRSKTAGAINKIISGADGLTSIKVAGDGEAIFLRYPLLTSHEEQRDELFAALWDAGIGVGRLYEKTLPAIYTPEQADRFPGADFFARRLITLPTHYRVDQQDLETMQNIIYELVS